MTSFFKPILILSVIILILSVVSFSVFFATRPEPLAKPNAAIHTLVRVAVLNGCGREGLAGLGAKKLRESGFDVTNGLGENADSFDFATSVIVNRKGDIEKANTCAEKTGIKEIIDQRAEDPYVIEDVIVVLGRDWDTLALFNEEVKD